MDDGCLSESCNSSIVSSRDSNTAPATLRAAVLQFRDECERRFEQLLLLLQRVEEEAERRQEEEVRRRQEEIHRVSEEQSATRERLERLSADNARLSANLQRATQQHEERMASLADRHREALLARRAVRTWQRYVRRRPRQQRSQEQNELEALQDAYEEVRAELDQLRRGAEASTHCDRLPNTQTINIFPPPHILSQSQHVPQPAQHVPQQPQHAPQQPQQIPEQQQPHVPQQPQQIPQQHVPQQPQQIPQQHVPQQLQQIPQQPQPIPQQPQRIYQQQQQHIPHQQIVPDYQPQVNFDPRYQRLYHQQPPAPNYHHIPTHLYQSTAPQPGEHPTGNLPPTASSQPRRDAPGPVGRNEWQEPGVSQLGSSDQHVATPNTFVPQIQTQNENQAAPTQQAASNIQTTASQSSARTSAVQTQTSQDQTTQYQQGSNSNRPPASVSGSNQPTPQNQAMAPPQGSSQSAQGQPVAGRRMDDQLDALETLRDRSRCHLQQLQMQRNLRRFNELRHESLDNNSQRLSTNAENYRTGSRSTSTDGRQPRSGDEGDCRQAQHIHVCHCLGPKPPKENKPFVCPQCEPLHKTNFRHQPVKQIPSRGILRTKNPR